MGSDGKVSKQCDGVSLRRIFLDLRPYRALIFGGAVLMLVAAPAGVFQPLVWKYVVDEVLTNGRKEMLVSALVVVQVLAIVSGAWRDRLFSMTGQRFVR